jgi:hypothetical protein
MLKVHINNRNSSRYHYLPLLFPTTRCTGLPKGRTTSIDIMYSVLDCIPRNFENINITHNTALNLPLKVFVLPGESPRKQPKNAQHLLAGDLFEYS